MTLKLSILSMAVMAFSLFSCGQKKSDRAFKSFNEGVALDLDAMDEQNKGNFEKADSLNKLSIEKFKETFKLDSTHALVRSSLGHSLYVDKKFDESIMWFTRANKFSGDAAMNYREMGLCKINLGRMEDGKIDIDKAFAMDTSREIRAITVQDLVDIGKLAFEYGDGYIKQGEPQKGAEYKRFAVDVLLLAFSYDASRKDIALTIADLADKIGEKETADKFRKLGGR